MALSVLDQWLTDRMGWHDKDVAPMPRQLREWQLDRLREIVAHARENSPFYACHLRDFGPDAIGSFEDFARLPNLMPDQLRDAPEQLLCVSQDEIARVVTLRSSGTTGEPKRIFHTGEDLAATEDFFRWGMSLMVQEGETAFVLMPGERADGVGRLLGSALARFGAKVVAHGVMEDGEAALDHCLSCDARCIVGSPAHLNVLACAWRERGLPKGIIRSVLLCWDAVPGAVVHNLERIFGCRVYRHWGMIETGLGGAVECAPHSGMHLRETDVFIEIVSPEGVPLPDGQFGEMVVTTPLKRGMPLIRYRTGDMGRIIPGPCECGSPLRRLDTHVARLDERVEVDGVGLSLLDLNESLYGVPGLADFAVTLRNGTVCIDAVGQGKYLRNDIREALTWLPETTEMELTVKRGCAPAIPGLGKRQIRLEREN